MAHIHSIYDTDLHFIVDPISRNITSESGKLTLMQHDHNSERFTFEIPRYIEGHDMSLTDKVEIHYINTCGSNKSLKSEGVYPVEDLSFSPTDTNIVICSWLISGNVTAYAGSLAFVLRFVCLDDTEITYQWFTGMFSNIKINSGIYNADAITDGGNPDVLEAWKKEIFASFGGNSDEDITATLAQANVYTNTRVEEAVAQANAYTDDKVEEFVNNANGGLDEYLKKSNEDNNVILDYADVGAGMVLTNAREADQGGEYVLGLSSPVVGQALIFCKGIQGAPLGGYGFEETDKFVIRDAEGNSHEVVHSGNLVEQVDKSIPKMLTLSAAEYAALATKDDNTLYFVTGEAVSE